MKLRRRTPRPEDQLIAAARIGASRAGPGSEGLTLKGRAPLRVESEVPKGDGLRAIGRLAGHLEATRLRAAEAGRGRKRGAAQPQIDAVDFKYATHLVGPVCQRLLGDLEADALLDTHGYVCAQVARHAELTDQDEHNLFSWLLEQAGAKSTPELMARMRAQRAARLGSAEEEG
jgi:hypothetical protein